MISGCLCTNRFFRYLIGKIFIVRGYKIEKTANAMHFPHPQKSIGNQSTKKKRGLSKSRKKVGCKTWKIIDSEIREMRLFHKLYFATASKIWPFSDFFRKFLSEQWLPMDGQLKNH